MAKTVPPKKNEKFLKLAVHRPCIIYRQSIFYIMESKKKVPVNTVTRDIKNLAAPTGNIYESVVILYKRANQIAVAEKKELMKKLEEFRNDRDTMDEVFENKEQIEISKYYERQPKPDLIAIAEFENGDLYYRKAQNDNPIDITREK